MMMTDYLEKACAYLDIEPEQVVTLRQTPDEIIVLADYGTGGIKKYYIPIPVLAAPEPEPEPEIEVEFVVEENDNVDYASLNVAELRKLAREGGISYSGLTKAELVEALEGDDG